MLQINRLFFKQSCGVLFSQPVTHILLLSFEENTKELMQLFWLQSFLRCPLLLTDSHTHYSRTSMARTLMAHLPWLFRTRARVPRKNPIAADLSLLRMIFLFILKMVYCMTSLESPR